MIPSLFTTLFFLCTTTMAVSDYPDFILDCSICSSEASCSKSKSHLVECSNQTNQSSMQFINLFQSSIGVPLFYLEDNISGELNISAVLPGGYYSFPESLAYQDVLDTDTSIATVTSDHFAQLCRSGYSHSMFIEYIQFESSVAGICRRLRPGISDSAVIVFSAYPNHSSWIFTRDDYTIEEAEAIIKSVVKLSGSDSFTMTEIDTGKESVDYNIQVSPDTEAFLMDKYFWHCMQGVAVGVALLAFLLSVVLCCCVGTHGGFRGDHSVFSTLRDKIYQ
eukprot:gnl/Dysnectes_brevis/3562_a4529_575.p1 GENE.gnl/Dysnectes_brevis/3562_a4529_575~~gnl/Dysnectes_brevis/3562_a4529_575.p1  ORF type:complete len:278 (-),score=48.54 gnl/Dysnectes_brevis/3562_a4529_575:43-876(-)